MTDQEPLPDTLRLSVDDTAHATVVTATGEIDLATADQLVAAVESLPDSPAPVVLSLSGVEFIDSSSVRSLLQCEQSVTERGRGFALLSPSVPVARILDLVDLRSRFVEVDDVASAPAAQPTNGSPSV